MKKIFKENLIENVCKATTDDIADAAKRFKHRPGSRAAVEELVTSIDHLVENCRKHLDIIEKSEFPTKDADSEEEEE